MGLYSNVTFKGVLIGNTIYNVATIFNVASFSRIVPLSEINNILKYKILRLILNLHSINCKIIHISIFMNMDDGTIFKKSILRCNGNTIHSLEIISRTVAIHAINTTSKATID